MPFLPRRSVFESLSVYSGSAADLVAPPALGFAGLLGLTARRLGRLTLREHGDLLHLDFDLRGVLLDGALHLVDDVVEMVVDEVLDLPGGQLDVLLDLRLDLAAEVLRPLRLLCRRRRGHPRQHSQGTARLSIHGSHWFSPDTMRAAPS